MATWLRLECKMLVVGWASRLPSEQYAAWVKFLQAVKLFGKRGGLIQESYFDDEQLAVWKISRNAFRLAISSAIEHGAVARDGGGFYRVTNWNKYQLDRTVNERVAKHRAKDVTDVTVTPYCNGCNDDGTVRDGTVRDGTEEYTHPPYSAVRDAWNETAKRLDLPSAAAMTDKRKIALRKRWKANGWSESWQQALGKIGDCPFLLGENDRGWRASLDWFLRPDSVTKILEGAYAGKGKPQPRFATDEDHAKGW